MSDVTLGQIITGLASRDAIHIAVAPVVASHSLAPGAHVGLMPDGTAGQSPNPIGIVDPFLDKYVVAGETFWLCLYQKTVTGMRHEWSHPSFDAKKIAAAAYFRSFATSHSLDYDELIKGITYYVDTSITELDVPELYHGSGEMDQEFWDHFKALTGKEGQGTPFICCT